MELTSPTEARGLIKLLDDAGNALLQDADTREVAVELIAEVLDLLNLSYVDVQKFVDMYVE